MENHSNQNVTVGLHLFCMEKIEVNGFLSGIQKKFLGKYIEFVVQYTMYFNEKTEQSNTAGPEQKVPGEKLTNLLDFHQIKNEFPKDGLKSRFVYIKMNSKSILYISSSPRKN